MQPLNFLHSYVRSEDEDYASPNDDLSGKSGVEKDEVQLHSNV